MANNIDNNIVNLTFDNVQFEKEAKTSIGTINSVSGALAGISSKNVSVGALASLGTGIGKVSASFSAMGAVAFTILSDITSAAFRAGIDIVSALTIDPALSGLREYETQIDAIQTILANTKKYGTELSDVNSALDELNTYADNTIYNFTQMTNAIGRFTTAGIDLDTSVAAIKGMSNLAAVSGASAADVARAQYQISQALASGTVKLQDWMSIENANMAGAVFQESLLETALRQGALLQHEVENIQNGSFRNSISGKSSWLTTDILLETLNKFTGDMTDAELAALGYTEAQIAGIQDMAATANSAATDFKTLTAVIAGLKEQSGSGWAQTMRTVIGDFEEAKTLWGTLAEIIGGYVQQSHDARNSLLEGWAGLGGYELLWGGIKAAIEGVINILNTIKSAWREATGEMSPEVLVQLTKAFRNAMLDFRSWTKDVTIMGDSFSILFKILDIVVHIVRDVWSLFSGLFSLFRVGNGLELLISTFSRMVDTLHGITTGASYAEIALKFIADAVNTVAEYSFEAGQALADLLSAMGFKIEIPGLQATEDGVYSLGDAFKSLSTIIDTTFGYVWTFMSGIFTRLSVIIPAMGGYFQDLFKGLTIQDLIQGGAIVVIMQTLKDMFAQLNVFTQGFDGIIKGLTDVLDAGRSALEAWQQNIKADTLFKIAGSVAILVLSLVALSYIKPENLEAGMTALLLLLGSIVTIMFMLNAMEFGKVVPIATFLMLMALSIVLLVGAIKMLAETEASLANIMTALALVVTLLAMMTTVIYAISLMNLEDEIPGLIGLSIALTFMAVAVLILAHALEKIASIESGLLGATGAIVALIGAVTAFSAATKGVRFGNTGAILALALTMYAYYHLIKLIGDLDPNTITGAVVTIGLLSVAISGVMASSSFGSPSSIVAVALALGILVIAIRELSYLDFAALAQGLGAIGVLAVLLSMLGPAVDGIKVSDMLLLAIALAALILPIMALGEMDADKIGQGLAFLAVSLAVLAGAAWALAPLQPVLAATAKSFLMFGLAVALVAFAISAVVGAILAVSAVGAAINSIILVIKLAILSFIPILMAIIADGIVSLAKIVINSAPILAEAIIVLILEIARVLGEAAPDVVKVIVDVLKLIIDGVLELLGDYGLIDLGAFALSIAILVGVMWLLAQVKKIAKDALIGAGALAIVIVGMTAAFGLLSLLDTELLMANSIGLSVALLSMTAAMYVLNKLPTSGAIAAVQNLGIFVAALTVVLIALAGLSQIEGFSEFMQGGVDVMTLLGQALGGFIGGLIGGIVNGVTSSFPQVGLDLAGFATNVEPFFAMLDDLDDDMTDKLGIMGDMVSAISGLDEVPDMTPLGEALNAFAPYILSYANTVKGIDTDGVEKSVLAAQMINDFANSLPKEGGALQAILGTVTSLQEFAEGMEALAPAIVAYSQEVAGLDTSGVEPSMTAAQMLSDLANTLPKSGGKWQELFGDQSLLTFAEGLVELAPAIVDYANTVIGLDVDAIEASIPALQALNDLANALPKDTSDTFVGWFSGDNSLENFGAGMASLGGYLYVFYTNVKDIDSAKLYSVVASLDSLARMAVNIGSVDADILENFAEGITNISVAGLTGFMDAFKDIYGDMKKIGVELINKVEDGVASARRDLIDAGEKNAQDTCTAVRNFGPLFWSAGNHLGQEMAVGLIYAIDDAEGAAQELGTATIQALKKALGLSSGPSRYSSNSFQLPQVVGYSLQAGAPMLSKVATDVGADTADAFNTAFQSSVNYAVANIDAHPTITPVINLDELDESLAAYQNYMALHPSTKLVGDIPHYDTVVRQPASVTQSDPANQNGTVNYQFVQNINSPEPIDRLAVYRATNTQFAQFKEALQK